MTPGLRRRGVMLAIAVGLLALVYRYLTVDFDNDHFMHLAWAQQIRLGEIPIRDFVEPGFLLQTLTSWVLLSLSGGTLLGEGLYCCATIAVAAALTVWLAREASGSTAVAVIATFISVAAFPRLYAYPKVVVYVAAALVMWRYATAPATRVLLLASVLTAVAFGLRHDHGLYVGLYVLVALGFASWPHARAAVRRAALYSVVVALLLAPFAAFVLTTGQAGAYVGFLIRQTQALASNSRFVPQGFSFDRSQPWLAIAPKPDPIIHVRWSKAASAETRQQLEQRMGLVPVEAAGERTVIYRATDLRLVTIQALVQDPNVEDTANVDRGRLAAPEALLPRLWIRARRALPPLRAQLLPGLLNEANALVWLNNLFVLAPFLVMIDLLLRRPAALPGGFGPRPAVVLAPLAILAAVTYQMLVRESIDTRLGDIASVQVVLLAWLVGRGGPLAAAARRVRGLAASVTVVLLLTTSVSAVAYGNAWSRWLATRITDGSSFAHHLTNTTNELRDRPIDYWAPEGTSSSGLRLMARYLSACTTPADRVGVVGFEPELFFYAERGFAGGQAFFYGDWQATEYDQRLVIERWQRQSVPIVIAMGQDWADFARWYPLVYAFVNERYALVEESGYDEKKAIKVFVEKTRRPTGLQPRTQLPCF